MDNIDNIRIKNAVTALQMGLINWFDFFEIVRDVWHKEAK